MDDKPLYVDARELFNPKLFHPPEAVEKPPEAPQRPILNGKLTLTVKEFAEYMQVSITTARELVRREGFPVIELPNKKLIPIEPLYEWLRKQTR